MFRERSDLSLCYFFHYSSFIVFCSVNCRPTPPWYPCILSGSRPTDLESNGRWCILYVLKRVFPWYVLLCWFLFESSYQRCILYVDSLFCVIFFLTLGSVIQWLWWYFTVIKFGPFDSSGGPNLSSLSPFYFLFHYCFAKYTTVFTFASIFS